MLVHEDMSMMLKQHRNKRKVIENNDHQMSPKKEVWT